MNIRQAHLEKNLVTALLDPLVAIRPGLVMAFGGVRFFEDGQLGRELKRIFPQAIVIGCSSAGEIVDNANVYDDTLVITAIAADNTDWFIATAVMESADESRQAGERLGAELRRHHIKSVFVLAPGLNLNGSDLAEGLAANLGPDTIVTGGLAGDGGRFQKTYTLCNEAVASNMVVAVGLRSDALQVSYGSQGGWEPFGLERRVTKAASNVLYELDGKPALQLYKEYLGDKAKELPASGLLYPLSIVKSVAGHQGLIRTILNIDEQKGSLILAGDIPQDSTVRLMHAKSDGLVAGAAHASKEACAAPSEGISLGILISCVGRKLIMGHDIDEEIEAVKSVFGPRSVITGFYSYGEICAFGQENRKPRLHNQTMTITRLAAC